MSGEANFNLQRKCHSVREDSEQMIGMWVEHDGDDDRSTPTYLYHDKGLIGTDFMLQVYWTVAILRINVIFLHLVRLNSLSYLSHQSANNSRSC